MADVLIRGMGMPQNCLFCPCSFWDERTFDLWCHAVSTYDDNLVSENVTAIEAHGGNASKVKRPDFCPLVELPEHGDLIDKSELLENSKVNGMYPHWIDTMDVKRAPVIVPSNKEETE